jgi:hypothetical protein
MIVQQIPSTNMVNSASEIPLLGQAAAPNYVLYTLLKKAIELKLLSSDEYELEIRKAARLAGV